MKIIISILLSLVSLSGFSQEIYKIQGKVKSLKEGSYIFLTYKKDKKIVVDSAQVKKQAFQFSGEVKTPTEATLILNGEQKLDFFKDEDQTTLYLTKGSIKITGPTLKNAIIKSNNQITNDYEKYKITLIPYDQAKADLKNIPYDELTKRVPEIHAMKRESDEKFIKENPGSYIAFNLLNSVVNSNNVYDVAIPAFEKSPDYLKNTAEGKALQVKMEELKSFANGTIAPDFTLPDTLGNAISLHSLRGKYVLLDFWASWCGPCRAENPKVVEAYNEFKDKNFTILSVTLDKEGAKDAWMKAIHDDHIQDWLHVGDLAGWESPVLKLYKIRAIPQNFLIDPDGKIVASNLRGNALKAALAKLIN